MSDHPPERPEDAVREGRPVEAQYVKQGRGGTRIVTVLAVALVLTAIGFVIVWLFWAGPFALGRANTGQQGVDAAAFQDGKIPAPPKADAPMTSTGEPTRPPTGDTANVNAPTVSAPSPSLEA